MGSRSAPIERIVTPLPAHVKTAHTTAVVMARPPGIQPSHALYTRSRRTLAPPSTSR